MPAQEELDKTLHLIWKSMDGWNMADAINLLADVFVNMSIKSGAPRDPAVKAIANLMLTHPHWPENQPKEKH